MKIGLFIPCYLNEFYPQAALSTLEILKKQNLEIEYPLEQTCCGQAQANTGLANDTKILAKRFVDIFSKYDYIVCPSGSCVGMVKYHYEQFLKDDIRYQDIKNKIYEFCEFLLEVVKVNDFNVSFPYKVGIHNSCHSTRELKLASASELNIFKFNKIELLLSKLKDIEFSKLNRVDECCGFGGTFSINEEAVSTFMGNDRLREHIDAKTQIITGADMSCLMHLEGLIKRQKLPLKVMYIAQILNGEVPHE